MSFTALAAGLRAAIGRFLTRRLFGGTEEDYESALEMSAGDFELPHEDPDLEARLPRSALGRPLATWSIASSESGASFSNSTWFWETSDRESVARAARALGLRLGDVSIAGTCRVDSRDPLDCVQASRYRNASEHALRTFVELPASETREIDGVTVTVVDAVRVHPLPSLQVQRDGYRTVKGDTVFDVATRDDQWLTDAVDQIARGPRYPSPTFEVDLPDGWMGFPVTDANLAQLADHLQECGPGFAASLRQYPPGPPFPPGTTYLAYDLSPEGLERFPTGFEVEEYLSLPTDFEQEVDEAQLELAAEFGDVRLEHLLVAPRLAARLSFRWGDAEDPLFGQLYIVRAGQHSYGLHFKTTWKQRDEYPAIFEAIVRSLRAVA